MKLSIGMMVKNEEKNLERCLKSLQPLRDAIKSELIIVDTGSEDATVEIARKYTDKIYFHPWNNNFSEMRNITISYATGEWFLVMDADEVLEDTQEIVDFLKSKEQSQFGAVAFNGKNFTDENDPKAFSTLLTLRIFKNDGNFHYEGAVHNQPVFQGEVLHIPVTLLHYGYMSTDKELMQKKFERTSAILRSELEKDPENIYYWYQLSVTYGMYKDYAKAIECIEKAYQLYQKQQPESAMYIYTHMALMYQLAGNYKKVEEVCHESLTIKEGYLDIYYFLAEAQAVSSKKQEAIENYLKYLNLLDGYQTSTSRDVSVVDYTLGYRELVYFNLANLYHNLGEYAKAVQYAEKITDVQSICQNIEIVIYSYLKLKQYREIREYHEKVKLDSHNLFYETMEKVVLEFPFEDRKAIAREFKDINHCYGLLNKIIIDITAYGKFSSQTSSDIENLDIENIPLFCSDIIYYLLKNQYPIEKILLNFKEIWLVPIFNYISNRHNDLNEIIYLYLKNHTFGEELFQVKLKKVLIKYLLLLDNNLSDAQYKEIFGQYIRDGIDYLKFIYTPYVIDNQLVYEVKNDEEVFLLYMYHAQDNKEKDQAKYLAFLRLGLQAFPTMKRGVEILLNELQEVNYDKQKEFELYKQTIKDTIKQLIQDNKMHEAKTILKEYKTIVPNDIEAILLESKICLN